MMATVSAQWEDFWNNFPNKFGKEEFMRQVGKTFSGQPISDKQFNLIISDITQKLELDENDQVLDLCCGNGLITSAIANKCQQIVGVDFSAPLIEIARQHHNAANIRYHHLSVLDVNPENIQRTVPFTKIYMYEALQHFQEEQLAILLERLAALSSEKTIIFLASIPHHRKLGKFYNSPAFIRKYYKDKKNNHLGLGTWWKQSFIKKTCQAYNLRCEFLLQPAELHTAHYRFDVRITRR